MKHRTARVAIIVAAILAGLLLLLITGLVAAAFYLSDPERATPIIRGQIDKRTESEVTLEAGWFSLGFQPVLHLRNLDMEARGRASVLDARLNPLGWLFGARLVNQIHVTDAAWTIRRGSGGSGPPAALNAVRHVDLTGVSLEIQHPSRAPSAIRIERAYGDLLSGDFTLTATGGQSRMVLAGRASDLSLDRFEGELELSGENFADFALILGLSAPDTPPFSLSGNLSHSGKIWTLEPFDGVVGDSDLSGMMAADFSGERPLLRGDLTSQSLDLDDLGVIIGAPSHVSDGEENPRQQAANAAYEASARLIPDAKLDFDRIRNADAEVTFRAASVQAGPIPLEALEFDFTLDNAVMTFEPIIFQTPQGGRLQANVRIDASVTPVDSHVDGRLENFDLADIAGGKLVRGRLASRFDLRLYGPVLRDAFGASNGEIILTASAHTELRQLAIEGSALDLGEVLLLILTEDESDPEFIPVNCAVARIAVENGIATADPIVIDTTDSLIRMNGTISLGDEILDLNVETDAKDVSWGNFLGGVQIGGTLRDPAVNVNASESLIQGGVAALLAGVAGPLGMIPFADLGLGESLPCQTFAESDQATDE